MEQMTVELDVLRPNGGNVTACLRKNARFGYIDIVPLCP